MASPATTRRTIVDDTSPVISYNGNWAFDSRGTQDGVGNSGPTFQHTLHRAGDFAFLSFYFEGSSVSLAGKVTAGNNADGSEPTWECRVDGQTIESASVERDQNNQLLCSVEGLQDNGGFHSLTLQTGSEHVWVDYIEYTPRVNTFNTWSPPQNFFSIPNQDPNLRHDASWLRMSNSALATSTVGATLSTTFIGTSLMWYGVIPTGVSGNATGTYSIDGQPPVTFVLNRPASSTSAELSNQVFFETPLLAYDEHTVTVNYTAGGGMPLSLDRLVVREQVSIASAIPSGFATATMWPSSSAAGWPANGEGYYRNPMSGGAIAATVIGSVLGFALIVAALLFFWRRRRRAAVQMPPQGLVSPHAGDEKAVGKADTSSIFSRIREKIKKEKEELDYAKPPTETEQLPAYKARHSGVEVEVVDRV